MANLAPADTAAAGLLALNRAGSLAEARAAAALISTPPQNLMVADRAGRIGMYLTGRTPVRRGGDGSLPAAGWDGSQDWTGWVPFDAMPHVEDPASGAIANANNRPAPPDSPVFLGRDWPDDARFRRIGALLAARPRHAAADFAAMQTDTVSTLARDLLGPEALLRRAPRPEGAAGTARDLLLAWDGDVRADRPEGLVFNAWIERLGDLALAAGGVPEGAWTPRADFLRLVLSPDGAGARLVRRRLRGARGPGAGRGGGGAGRDPGAGPRRLALGRGACRPLRAPAAARPARARLADRPGGTDRRRRMDRLARRHPRLRPDPFAHVHGAGLRLVADLADPDATLAVIATGSPATRPPAIGATCWRPGGTAGCCRCGKAPEALEGRITSILDVGRTPLRRSG